MSKRRVLDLPGHAHFLTFSTYQRRRFLDSGETRDIVIEVLQKCLVTHQASCVGFVIMPDHVHALIFGGDDFKISPFVKVWKKTSSYRIKTFFERELGRYEQLCPEECPIWQARFYDYNVDSDEKLNEKSSICTTIRSSLAWLRMLWRGVGVPQDFTNLGKGSA